MPRQDARLAHGLIIAQLDDPADRDAPTPEGVQQLAAGGVITYDPYRQHSHAEVGEIANGVATAARDDVALAVLEDEHWRLARNPRNLAKDELISHQISH